MCLRLAITGGIGCGKSEVLKILREKQWGTADADQLVHQLFDSDASVRSALVAAFGPQALDGASQVDRSYLAGRVFEDREALAWLEALTHPRARVSWNSMMQAQAQKKWAIEVPLLFEKGLVDDFDVVLCVISSEPMQIARLSSRGWSYTMIKNRLKNQWPLKNKVEAANFVLLNEGNIGFLQSEVEELLRRLGV